MVRDADAHASEDKVRRELIEKKNHLDSLIYNSEKTLREQGEKLPEAEKTSMEEVLSAAKQDLASEDLERITAAQQRVETGMHKVAEILYKAQADAGAAGAAPGAGAAGGEQKPDGDVIDAEYTEDKGQS
jgi:molecular chaperone DnaK